MPPDTFISSAADPPENPAPVEDVQQILFLRDHRNREEGRQNHNSRIIFPRTLLNDSAVHDSARLLHSARNPIVGAGGMDFPWRGSMAGLKHTGDSIGR